MVAGAPILSQAQIYPYDEKSLATAGEQCSMAERRADEATRDVVNWLKCEFLVSRVGEEFSGVVVSVTGFGLFVQLSEMYIEGLVHITGLPKDYYHHEVAHHRLVGERTGRIFRLGDKLRVKVARVDLDERKIDFELVEKEQKKSEKTTRHIKKLSKKLSSSRKKHPKKKIKNKLN
jgi:ribonuclease R